MNVQWNVIVSRRWDAVSSSLLLLLLSRPMRPPWGDLRAVLGAFHVARVVLEIKHFQRQRFWFRQIVERHAGSADRLTFSIATPSEGPDW